MSVAADTTKCERFRVRENFVTFTLTSPIKAEEFEYFRNNDFLNMLSANKGEILQSFHSFRMT